MSFGAEARARLAVLPVYALVLPWRCSLVPPLADREPPAATAATATQPVAKVSAATEKREPPAERVPGAPRHDPPARTITLPEEIVIKAMAAGQAQFLRCWAKVQQDDPGLDASKVHLHLDVDAAGRVTAVHSDTSSPTFARCLARVASHLAFPAPGRAAVVDLPLMFR